MTKRTAVIGAGVMGETLLSGLIRAGRPASSLLVGEKRAERAAGVTDAAQRDQIISAVCGIRSPSGPRDRSTGRTVT